MPKKNPHVSELEGIAKRLRKVTPRKAYELVDHAFLVFAAAGAVDQARAMLRLAYEGALTRPNDVAHALGTGPADGFSAAVGLGDVTHGEPCARHLVGARTFEDRLRRSESVARERLTGDAYGHLPAPSAHWSELTGRELWRSAQMLARAGNEADALAALTKYMDAWCDQPDDRGAGYGQEVALAFDSALRHGRPELVARWAKILGPRLLEWGITEALCLPAVAKAIVDGVLAPVVGISREKAQELAAAIESAVCSVDAGDARETVKGTKPAKRSVSAEYSQFYLEHDDSPVDQACFQDERESKQGFSLSPTKAGVATPTETSECFVELALAQTGPDSTDLAKAVQAVSFPFTVQGPLFVRSVGGGGDDEDRAVVIPHGTYDVLVRFFPKRAAKSDAKVGLRAYKVRIDFHPAGSLQAPRCLKLEFGQCPKEIFVPRS